MQAHQGVVVVVRRGSASVGFMPVVYLVRVHTEDDEPVLVRLGLQGMQYLSAPVYAGTQVHNFEQTQYLPCRSTPSRLRRRSSSRQKA